MKASRRNQIPIEFSPQGDHCERLTHAGSEVFIGVRVQDDLVKRVGIAIEDRRHHAVTRGGDPITEDRIDLVAGNPHQTCQGPIRDLFLPLPEEVEDEEKRRRLRPSGRFQREVGFNLLDEEGQHLDTLSRCSLQRFFRKTLGVGQFVEDFPRIDRGRLHQEFKLGARTVPTLWAGSIWNLPHYRRNNHINCLSLTDQRVIRSCRSPEMG